MNCISRIWSEGVGEVKIRIPQKVFRFRFLLREFDTCSAHNEVAFTVQVNVTRFVTPPLLRCLTAH